MDSMDETRVVQALEKMARTLDQIHDELRSINRTLERK